MTPAPGIPPVTAEEVAARRHRFDLFNVQRIYSAMMSFSRVEADIFGAILPLLHRNYSGIAAIMHPEDTPCGIQSFSLRGLHVNAFEHLFPSAHEEPVSGPPAVLAVAMVGSIGTVAQTHKSDFDYVVFVDANRLGPQGMRKLSRKFTAVERWTLMTMGVETHFFFQDIYQFKNNQFGVTDRENVGSALGRLFKDEFYRTAIWLAGKKPLWWVLPPGYPEAAADTFPEAAGRAGIVGLEEYLDLGHILSAGTGEFFGAALWQMNKALGSPFKSILKMGLLESYLIQPSGGLLCEELKRKVLATGAEMELIDPYLMLFERVNGFYASRGMGLEVQLMKGALLLKLGLKGDDIRSLLKLRLESLDERKRRIASVVRTWGWTEKEVGAFEGLFAGTPGQRFRSVNQAYKFFLDAYIRFSDWLKLHGTEARLISEEDLTVLGRKLFTHFQNQPGKVRLIQEHGGKKPSRISLVPEKALDGTWYWALYEGTLSTLSAGLSAPLNTGKTVMEILSWVVVNGLWSPGTKFYFRPGQSHYVADDVAHVLAEMGEFFGSASRYDPDRDDYLRDPQMMRGFLVVNFALARPLKSIRRVDALFLNSWGEFTLQRMAFKNAVREVAKVLMDEESTERKFGIKVVAPPSLKDPRIVEEFDHAIKKSIETRKYSQTGLKKATLDLY